MAFIFLYYPVLQLISLLVAGFQWFLLTYQSEYHKKNCHTFEGCAGACVYTLKIENRIEPAVLFRQLSDVCQIFLTSKKAI